MKQAEGPAHVPWSAGYLDEAGVFAVPRYRHTGAPNSEPKVSIAARWQFWTFVFLAAVTFVIINLLK